MDESGLSPDVAIEKTMEISMESEAIMEKSPVQQDNDKAYTADTRITDVISGTAFEDYGRLRFPVNEGYYGGNDGRI